jgi:ATP-binding cassette subfamily B protein
VSGGRLTLGEFVAFGRYLVLLSWPLIAFGWVINIVQRGVASWERMLEVLDVPAAGAGPSRVDTQLDLSGRLEVRRLTFRYPNVATNALEDVSFALEPGRTVALVGATGSGKSTLVQLLPRLHEPPAGTVFVDGTDIRDLPLDGLRRAIGVVPQEPFLFSGTIGANVAFGLPGDWRAEPARARVDSAVSTAGLSTDVEGFAQGLETVLGERGITLSGGQKQRVALARALAIDPRILVLDDALSAVDTATEETILHGLRGVRRSRACLIIAHRISTVRDADEILVLNQGRVAERGTHDALVARNGLYADMHRRQMLEEEVGQWGNEAMRQ